MDDYWKNNNINKPQQAVVCAAGQKIDIERGCGGLKDTLFSEGLY